MDDETHVGHERERVQRVLPLTAAAFSILVALAGRDKHGYAIMREIADSSGGTFRLGPGTLYRSIKHLLAAGMIAESGDRPDPALDNERRRYYHLTVFGRQVVQAEAERLARLVRRAGFSGLLTGELRPEIGGVP